VWWDLYWQFSCKLSAECASEFENPLSINKVINIAWCSTFLRPVYVPLFMCHPELLIFAQCSAASTRLDLAGSRLLDITLKHKPMDLPMSAFCWLELLLIFSICCSCVYTYCKFEHSYFAFEFVALQQFSCKILICLL